MEEGEKDGEEVGVGVGVGVGLMVEEGNKWAGEGGRSKMTAAMDEDEDGLRASATVAFGRVKRNEWKMIPICNKFVDNSALLRIQVKLKD